MTRPVNRRAFLSKLSAGAVAGAFAAGRPFSAAGKTVPFFEQYHSGVMNILGGLRDTQVPLVEREMATAFDRINAGGTFYSQITSGHFPTEETALDRTGQPGVMAFLPRNAEADVYATIKPGDMIVTNTINLNNIEARKRGVRVVAVTVNYYPFSKTPPEEGYQIEYEGKLLKIEDTADVTIDSQMPWHNGLVRAPQLPAFAIIPGGGLAQAAVYWMCAAELAGLKAGKGKKSASWARDYTEICIERAVMAGADRPKHARVAATLADLVLAGGRWFVYGVNHALVSDAVGVANGPMVTRRYNAEQVRKGDIVMIGAYSSNHPEEIAVARESRRKGAYVVALTPFSTDGDSSGERLYKEADAAFDTFSPESWGAVTVSGLDRKVCPTTGVIGDLVMWLLVAQWTDEMGRRGQFPYYYKGLFMKNGPGYNASVRPYFMVRGW